MTANPRPLSPHLQVYRPQLTSILSITHRATGVFLALGSLLLVYWLGALAGGADSYAQAQALFSHWLGKLALLGWTFALFYHLCNGIRHLFWDAGYGYSIPVLYRSGYTVLAVAALLTFATWVVA